MSGDPAVSGLLGASMPPTLREVPERPPYPALPAELGAPEEEAALEPARGVPEAVGEEPPTKSLLCKGDGDAPREAAGTGGGAGSGETLAGPSSESTGSLGGRLLAADEGDATMS
mmetsp:Transcript_103319/g.183557  ORF Transcript_103319/g.183557 Transcript_103319/m.183557 type:complete len:115 (-) Transcript_103319:53-397(-)|eukprot:CAMPEP_0197678668 /NCGR_PEP_ID=MMETSP1338-20131121/90412_1 /TAXON_ID=43686 ORGANISM="Pelagodinium beii, Strain RCC1491" /NCGR_SAMPLE_ID=MMETSP1338 /ASSEMBLY_ACC=CAM_ASM_000754 /LENGTH=114 /DNA_ID=CAMNT_0043259627 /DNA_START=99 /DNA_END=443 /DNA_ORIENTATION=+